MYKWTFFFFFFLRKSSREKKGSLKTTRARACYFLNNRDTVRVYFKHILFEILVRGNSKVVDKSLKDTVKHYIIQTFSFISSTDKRINVNNKLKIKIQIKDVMSRANTIKHARFTILYKNIYLYLYIVYLSSSLHLLT